MRPEILILFTVDWVLAGGLGLLLLLTGIVKLLNWQAFRDSLISTFGFGRTAAVGAGVATPVVEVGAAILLLVPDTRVAGYFAAVAFFAVTATVVGAAILRGHTGDCGCFGAIRGSTLSGTTLLRLLVLCLLSVIGLISRVPSVASIQPTLELPIAMAVIAIAGLMIVGFATIGVKAIRGLRRQVHG